MRSDSPTTQEQSAQEEFVQEELIAAIKSRNLEGVKQAIEQGANVNLADLEGRCPLHDAVIIGDINVVKYLIKQGARADVTNGNGWNLLDLAVISGNLDLVKFFIAREAQEAGLDTAKIIIRYDLIDTAVSFGI